MIKVASIIKHRDRETTIQWIERLPRKYPIDRIRNFLLLVRKGNTLLWTEGSGLKIL